MPSNTAALILAAGQGKRMRSKLPKVLHPLAGLPLIAHVVKTALARNCSPIVVVVGPEGRRVRELLTAHFPKAPLKFAVQEQPRGTGDAARAGLDAIPGFKGKVLILYGDVPLLTTKTLARLHRAASRSSLALLTAEVDNPHGYGRIIRDGRRVLEVVEQKDATAEQKRICEVNVGVYLCHKSLLTGALGGLSSKNAQGELYLTDIVALAANKKGAAAVTTEDLNEVRGINDRVQLAEVEVVYRWRQLVALMQSGVTCRDPDTTHIDATVEVARDVVIGTGVQLRGRTKIGKGAIIEGPTVIKDSLIAPGAHVHSFSHLDGAEVGKMAQVGPFARLRPGARLEEGARVGNFVEMKKTRLGKGAKANHLAYLGDADIGAGSNIGAGTITCNYDGFGKHPTTLGKGVFIGSNVTLVAPIRLEDGAYVAAGSTITKRVPKDALAFGRARQTNRDKLAARLRAKLKAKKKER